MWWQMWRHTPYLGWTRDYTFCGKECLGREAHWLNTGDLSRYLSSMKNSRFLLLCDRLSWTLSVGYPGYIFRIRKFVMDLQFSNCPTNQQRGSACDISSIPGGTVLYASSHHNSSIWLQSFERQVKILGLESHEDCDANPTSPSVFLLAGTLFKRFWESGILALSLCFCLHRKPYSERVSQQSKGLLL